MLKFDVFDLNGSVTSFQYPLYADIIFSQDAPAAGLRAVFAVSGKIPGLLSADVFDGDILIFRGFIDEQLEYSDKNGCRLEIRARSIEALLLDNEARPQTYFMPSMPLLMERHFSKYGFDHFIGSQSAAAGRLSITKGMSEWDVLDSFCRNFLGTCPAVTPEGVIDISGNNRSEDVFISKNCPVISATKKLSRKNLVSDLFARTYSAGGYEMHLDSSLAKLNKVKKTRFVNAVDSNGKSVETVRRLMKKTEDSFECYELVFHGIVRCRPGDVLTVEGFPNPMTVTGMHYVRNNRGDITRIYAEVKN